MVGLYGKAMAGGGKSQRRSGQVCYWDSGEEVRARATFVFRAMPVSQTNERAAYKSRLVGLLGMVLGEAPADAEQQHAATCFQASSLTTLLQRPKVPVSVSLEEDAAESTRVSLPMRSAEALYVCESAPARPRRERGARQMSRGQNSFRSAFSLFSPVSRKFYLSF